VTGADGPRPLIEIVLVTVSVVPRYGQLVGVGIVHTPPMHAAGAWQPGPFLVSQLAKSAAGATHEPVPVLGVTHCPLAEQVVSAPPINPHGWPVAAAEIAVQTPFVALLQ